MERKCLNCLYQHTPCPPLGDMDTNCNWISAYHKWQPKEQIMEKKCSNCRYDLIGCPSGDPYCGHSNSYCKWESDDCPDCNILREANESLRTESDGYYNQNGNLKRLVDDLKEQITSLKDKLQFVHDTYGDIISRLTDRRD